MSASSTWFDTDAELQKLRGIPPKAPNLTKLKKRGSLATLVTLGGGKEKIYTIPFPGSARTVTSSHDRRRVSLPRRGTDADHVEL